MPNPPRKNPTEYQRRQGKLSPRQQLLLQQSPYFYPTTTPPWQKLLSTTQPIVCEIGFGKGELLLARARKFPHYQFIGIDLFTQGIASVLGKIADHNSNNIHIIQADALTLMQTLSPAHTLQMIDILHPDPWPKKRHHKRRLITPKFIHACIKCLHPEGRLRIITDDSSYQEHIETLLATIPLPQQQQANIPAITKYGRRAERLKQTIHSYCLYPTSASAFKLDI